MMGLNYDHTAEKEEEKFFFYLNFNQTQNNQISLMMVMSNEHQFRITVYSADIMGHHTYKHKWMFMIRIYTFYFFY